jgi:hypothetical protein
MDTVLGEIQSDKVLLSARSMKVVGMLGEFWGGGILRLMGVRQSVSTIPCCRKEGCTHCLDFLLPVGPKGREKCAEGVYITL